ncbi:hypothetical protein ACQJBY_048267 [Aegilops geniculata]
MWTTPWKGHHDQEQDDAMEGSPTAAATARSSPLTGYGHGGPPWKAWSSSWRVPPLSSPPSTLLVGWTEDHRSSGFASSTAAPLPSLPETLCQGRKQRIKLKNQVLQSADHSKLEYQAAVTPITKIRRIQDFHAKFQVSSQAKGILLAASNEHHGAPANFTTSGDQQPAIPGSEPKSSRGAAEDWSCGSIREEQQGIGAMDQFKRSGSGSEMWINSGRTPALWRMAYQRLIDLRLSIGEEEGGRRGRTPELQRRVKELRTPGVRGGRRWRKTTIPSNKYFKW